MEVENSELLGVRPEKSFPHDRPNIEIFVSLEKHQINMLCGGNNSSLEANDLSDLDIEDINLSLSTHNTEARDDFTTYDDETPANDQKQLSKQIIDLNCRTQEQEEDHGETECTGDEAAAYRKHFDGEQQEKQSEKTRRREKKCREARRKKDVSAFGLAKGMASMAFQKGTDYARNDPYRKSSSGKHSDANIYTAEHASALNIMMRAEEMVATRYEKEKADAKVKAKASLQWQG